MVRKILSASMIDGWLVVSACNTVAGAGEDIQSASEAGKDVIN